MTSTGKGKQPHDYRWLIYRTLGQLMPDLLMLGNERLGSLSKEILSRITGVPVGTFVPPDMDALEDLALTMCLQRPENDAPLWALLYPRARERAPFLFALGDAELGLIMRSYIEHIYTKEAMRLPEGTPEAAATAERMKNAARWLATTPPAEIKEAYRTAEDAMDRFIGVISFEDENQVLAARHTIGARLAGAPDVAANAKETALADIAENLANGREVSDAQIIQIYKKAEAKDKKEEEAFLVDDQTRDENDADVDYTEDDDPSDYVGDDEDEPMSLAVGGAIY